MSNSERTAANHDNAIPDRATIVARAEKMRPWLIEQQAATEERTFYSEEVHQAFHEAGFYRISTPRCYGGFELDATTFYQVMMSISRGCPSTGWMLALGAAHGLNVASYYPKQAQDEMLGADETFIASGSFAHEKALARPVDGGYMVRGTWHFCSGVPYATYHLGLVPTKAENYSEEDLLMVAIPRSEYRRLDNWGDLIGLKGSGSHSVVVEEEVFVPEYRAVRMIDMEDDSGQTPGYKLHGNTLFAGRFFGFAVGELASVQVGAAQGAVDELERVLVGKRAMSPINAGIPKIEHHDYQRCVGMATAYAESAHSIVSQVGEQYMENARLAVQEGEPFSDEKVWRLYGQQMTAAKLSWEAGEIVFRAGSTTGARDGETLQRYWRDLCAFRSNGLHQHEFRAHALAQSRFGLPVDFY